MSPCASGYPANPGCGFGRLRLQVSQRSWLTEAAEFFFVAADGGGDGVQCGAEVGDLGGESGEGVGFLAAGAVFFDDGAQVGVAVEGGSPEAGAGGDLVEGDGLSGENDCGAGVLDALAALLGWSSGLCLADVGVEAFDEAAVAFGFAAPAAGFGVAGEGFGVGALGGQDGQVAGVGAEVRAVLADVGVGAGALDLGADAEPAGEAGLDRRGLFPVAVDDRQRGAPGGWLGGQRAEVGFRGGQAPARIRSCTVESNSRP